MQPSNQQFIQAAQQFGTPLFIYDTEKITTQYNKLTSAFNKPGTKFFYACKALTNINILKHIKSLGAGIDCSSINEVKLALHAGFQPDNILYTSNSIAFDEIVEAKDLGVNVTIDSISNLQKFGEAYGNSYPVSIRIRPNILAGGNMKISTGHDESKFGISVTQLNEILFVVAATKLHINGLHIHTGSDIIDADVFLQGINVLFSIAHHFPQLQFVDLGSGFKVKYKEDDKETDIDLLAQKIYTAFENNDDTRQLEIWFEPGKFLVSECGYLLSKVNVLKPTNEADFAGIDTGFNHLIRPMFYGSYHTIKNISNPDGELKEYAIVGNLCETDTFAWQRQMGVIKEGDIVCFYNAGAYCFEMSSNFNSRFKPAEVMMRNNQFYLIRERDNLQDLLRKQVEANV